MDRPELWGSEWRAKMIQEMDNLIVKGARSYLESRSLKPEDLRPAFDELEKLKRLKDPNYDMIGLPAAYACRYMAQRTMSVLAGLTRLLDLQEAPRTVIDIGSGTDATALAVALMFPDGQVKVARLEDSDEMVHLADFVPLASRVDRSRLKGDLSSIGSNAWNPGLRGDLIVFSACYPYEWIDWDSTRKAMTKLIMPGSKVLVIEPDPKKAYLDKLRAEFAKIGLVPADKDRCCHSIPDVRLKGHLHGLRELGSASQWSGPNGEGQVWWQMQDWFLTARTPDPA